MDDLIFVSRQERKINVHSTLFKASAYIMDTLRGNTLEVNLVKVYELYNDVNAILRAIEDGRFAMKDSLPCTNQKEEEPQAKSNAIVYRNSESGRGKEYTVEEARAMVMTPAERAAEVIEKKKRGRPRKNPVPET